jgi:tRNA(fMet)-specific endonuclease VapC
VLAVLDTNHFRALVEVGPPGKRLQALIRKYNAHVFACIPAVEETLRGWLAVINSRTAGDAQVDAYFELQRSIEITTQFTILPFTRAASAVFHRLRTRHRRTGTMDLKIAAICLAHDMTLLTQNLRDFADIEGLRIKNWLD